MKAAYKWRLQNGIYGYITNEDNSKGPFIYTVSTHKREYYRDGSVINEETNDGEISLTVSQLSQDAYIALFEDFKTMVNTYYPEVSLLDVSYYYNMENDECTESASSLKCAITDIIFTVSSVTAGEEPNVTLTEINTSTANGDIEYVMDFVLPSGPKGDVPEVNATASARTVDPTQSASASVLRTGSDEEPVFNFGFAIPRGKGVDQNNNIIVNTVTATTINAATISATTISGVTVNTTNANITNLITSGITTNNIETKEIKDKVFLGTADSTGWWTIYKVPRESSSVRIHIAQTVSCEEFYVEVNTGWWNSDAIGNIAILNGYKPWSSERITKIRIVDDVNGDSTNHLADIQIYIAELYNGALDLRFNNIEGPGEFVFEKDNHTGIPGHNYTFDLNNGMKAEKFVKNGGTSSQYLMADGSVTALSAGTNVTITKSGSSVTISAAGGTSTDEKVKQEVLSESSYGYRPVVLGYSTFDPDDEHQHLTTVTDKTYVKENIYVGCGDGTIYTNGGIYASGGVYGPNGYNVSLPIGSIVMWAGSTAPSGWLLCNGEYVCLGNGSQGQVHPEGHDNGVWYGAKYQKIINVISTTFGVTGNQYGTHYRLPNLQQRFPLGALQGGTIGKTGTGDTVTGWSTSLAATGGTSGQTLSINEMPRHNHIITQIGGTGTHGRPSTDATHYEYGANYEQGSWSAETYTDPTGKSKPHNNIPPFLAINFIIKYA